MITVVFQRFLYLPNLTLLSPFLPTVLLVKTFFLLDNDEVDGVDGGGYNFEVDGDDGDDGGGPKIWSWYGYGEEVDGSFMIIRATVSDSSTHNLILVGEPKSDLLTSLLVLTSLPFLTS